MPRTAGSHPVHHGCLSSSGVVHFLPPPQVSLQRSKLMGSSVELLALFSNPSKVEGRRLKPLALGQAPPPPHTPTLFHTHLYRLSYRLRLHPHLASLLLTLTPPNCGQELKHLVKTIPNIHVAIEPAAAFVDVAENVKERVSPTIFSQLRTYLVFFTIHISPHEPHEQPCITPQTHSDPSSSHIPRPPHTPSFSLIPSHITPSANPMPLPHS